MAPIETRLEMDLMTHTCPIDRHLGDCKMGEMYIAKQERRHELP